MFVKLPATPSSTDVGVVVFGYYIVEYKYVCNTYIQIRYQLKEDNVELCVSILDQPSAEQHKD